MQPATWGIIIEKYKSKKKKFKYVAVSILLFMQTILTQETSSSNSISEKNIEEEVKEDELV